jgi:uncharacterized low-complexity protein
MKKTLFLLTVLGAISLGLATSAFAQEKTQIKVKSSEVVTGVVIVDILKDGKSYELQCNQGAYSCTALKNGTYLMVELPPNFGMYVCQDVEVYRIENGNAASSGRIGEYCLIEK